jgi:Icc-related predicted phosphoesterase
MPELHSAMIKDKVRIAAIADLHYQKTSHGVLRELFAHIGKSADVLLICGDLVHLGLPEETEVLVQELAVVKLPVIAVLGNHEFESSKQEQVKKILVEAGIVVLDGTACEYYGVGFAGVKGFAGGFGRLALEPWGEQSIKDFVKETVRESLKLESALASLRTSRLVALLHYAPIRATVEGEPPEILPFLGSSRLEEPLNRYNVTVAFHGHAHRGQPEGKTREGTPVYNVALRVLEKKFPNRPPFRLFEIPLKEEGESHAAGAKVD